ncbi:DedA family protein [Patescibacteria group bacterium]|nr:DedA family protein [Patescibacteria group bacterium]
MEIIDIILHLDKNITNIINLFGPFTYVIIFLIIFAETGLVVTPFLPGDSLLFIAGTLAGKGDLQIWGIYFTISIAAILGDSVNYWFGHKIGPRVFSKENSRIFKKEYLEKTRNFYEKHGGKTIILARFVPLIRTFAPFVAGVGKMHYRTFFFYNVTGAFIWSTILVFAGYFFGGLPVIKNNFEFAVIGIIIFSLIPVAIEYYKSKKESQSSKKLHQTSYKDIQKTFEKEHLHD